MKVVAKKWFYEESTNANYEKGEEIEVTEEVAKELEKQEKVFVKKAKKDEKQEIE